MNDIGIDLHKQSISVCVVNQSREVIKRNRFSCQEARKIEAFFVRRRPFRAMAEPTASYEWLFGLLEPHAERMALAHPGKLPVIAESTRKARAILGLVSQSREPVIAFTDGEGVVRVHMRASDNEPNLYVGDASGKVLWKVPPDASILCSGKVPSLAEAEAIAGSGERISRNAFNQAVLQVYNLLLRQYEANCSK